MMHTTPECNCPFSLGCRVFLCVCVIVLRLRRLAIKVFSMNTFSLEKIENVTQAIQCPVVSDYFSFESYRMMLLITVMR